MSKTPYALIASLFILTGFSFVPGLFYSQKVVGTIKDDRLEEASGLDQSYTNPGYFWTHNDSGNKPKIYLIDQEGKVAMEVELKGVKNRDWEEIVTVREGDRSFIYLAEIGDNRAVHSSVSLIRIPEPSFSGIKEIEIEKDQISTMHFQYAEGARDAEALMYDYGFNEFVLVTKREKQALVYAFPFHANENPITVTALGTLPRRLFTAADMSEEGEILLKRYNAIHYWDQSDERAVDRILEWNPVRIDYTPEPQGEAICWYQKSFFTLSEKNKGEPQQMLFFERAD